MLKSILSSPALQPIILGQIRHYVTVAGSALATAGYLDGSGVQAGVGAVMTIIALIWSAFSKKMAV